MSLPKHITSPSLSSSPSRQSIRRSDAPSRPQSIIDRPPTAQQTHPLDPNLAHGAPTDNPSQTEPQPFQADGHHDFPPPSQQQPPFQPFFTVIEDANTSEYYHPTVHYIFSDDDTDIVTEATLRSLETDQDPLSNGGPKGKSKPARPGTTRDGQDEVVYDEDDEFASPRKDPLLPPPIPGVRDNYIILDMETAASEDPHHAVTASASNRDSLGLAFQTQTQTQTQTHTGVQSQQHQQHTNPPTQTHPQTQPPDRKTSHPSQFTVTSAHSLTPAWQVLHTDVIPAPTFENHTSNEPVNGGLMLKIQGTAGLPMTVLGKERDKERSSQRLEDMMDQFSKRLGELRQVIEAGGQGNYGVEEAEERKGSAALGTEFVPDQEALGGNLDGGAPGNTDGMENEGQGS
ncbi:hypothetical protein P170DRAFT_433507 [Aspergillus steynii IBT 23096]|uniref:Anaphase promoting complex subunit 11 n=1 Tax=Aspergillus steynii IBT 23096 TaxID=1392250 RepID=A0A2I2GFD0_9EURO|nr:uncharacterized protein P170DRAFT_433507 [Aspergillus steynii IBT 23096]PLB51588.1 hypothetical protein P170DRAFT_433507 [Aspergillus steynii IBT 23096]